MTKSGSIKEVVTPQNLEVNLNKDFYEITSHMEDINKEYGKNYLAMKKLSKNTKGYKELFAKNEKLKERYLIEKGKKDYIKQIAKHYTLNI